MKQGLTGIKKCYLGDGLYMEDDGFQFRLFTQRGAIEHEVFLDPSVFEVLLKYIAQFRGLEITFKQIEKLRDTE